MPKRLVWAGFSCLVLMVAVIGGARAWWAEVADHPPTSSGLVAVSSIGPDPNRNAPDPGHTRRLAARQLTPHSDIDGRLDGGAEPRNKSGWLGEVPPLLAAATVPGSNVLLGAGTDGVLRLFDLPSLRPVGELSLAQPLYQMTIDPRRRLLYAASFVPETLRLGILGEREQAVGDLHVFDVDSLLSKGSASPPQPLRTAKLGSHLSQLVLCPAGDHLYFLADSPTDLSLVRLNTRTWNLEKKQQPRIGGPMSASLSPDGKWLYCLSGSRLFSIDTGAWATSKLYLVESTHFAVLGENEERVHLLDRQQELHLLTADLRGQKVLGRYAAAARERAYLARSADSRFVAISTSGVVSGQIWLLDLAGQGSGSPVLHAHFRSTPKWLIRGPVFISHDGQYLITGSGQVFHWA